MPKGYVIFTETIVGERHASADANAAIVGGFEMPGS